MGEGEHYGFTQGVIFLSGIGLWEGGKRQQQAEPSGCQGNMKRGRGRQTELGDEAAMEPVQLFMGQHPKASRAGEGHFAHIYSVLSFLFLGPKEG